MVANTNILVLAVRKFGEPWQNGCKITFILNSILHLTKGQLLFNAITGYGDWYGAETFMYPMRTFPSGCVHLPCIPWRSWKPEMFSSGVDFSEFDRNTDKGVLTFRGTPQTTKKSKEKRRTRKNSKKTEESDKEELRVRDTVRGGRDKASVWQTLSPVSRTSGALFQIDSLQSTTDVYDTGLLTPIVPIQNQNASHQRPYEQTARQNITGISRLGSRFQDQVNPQVTANEPHVADIKLNKTFGRESPLIQVYVIASGSGGAHTSIGEGGYHGKNNGQSNFETFHLKMKVPENLADQTDSIDIVMGTARQFQESRKRNPIVSEKREWNRNLDTEGDLNTQKKVEDTEEDISSNDSDAQLNSENEELKEQTQKAAATSNHEVIHKVLGGTVKHEFQNYWAM
ncbi:hypothetical protein AVEN_245606-1 [Araneus ventricosus]|uniref:Uncharacterized protein n=1 Tax=Araneus ventricosus TaxID=182803 RepID=A0A4Y2IST0_ARAVE|nr:hypothetical protein AVEN_245606-1 [Araneus ventricosus]